MTDNLRAVTPSLLLRKAEVTAFELRAFDAATLLSTLEFIVPLCTETYCNVPMFV